MTNEEKRKAVKELVIEADKTGLYTYCIIQGRKHPVRVRTGTPHGVRSIGGILSKWETVTSFYNN